MVVGVTDGFTKKLVLAGVGYKAAKSGNKVTLNVGYSHPVDIFETADIKLEVASQTEVVVSGIDKTKVGQYAATVRSIRKPEPYHGYGIHYSDEVIERKEGKTAGK
jgi:large subunit ribosomal protein L6